jgi:hypothetical protein
MEETKAQCGKRTYFFNQRKNTEKLYKTNREANMRSAEQATKYRIRTHNLSKEYGYLNMVPN